MVGLKSLVCRTGCLAVAVLVGLASQAVANEDKTEASSRREVAAVEAAKVAGGRVAMISAESDEREVTFALLGDKIKDEHVQDVAAISNVIWLNLAGTGITDKTVEAIKSMKLQKLHLEKTGVGDAALKSLSEMESLVYLNLYGTKVTDAGLQHLAKLKNLRQLHLWQSGATKVGADKVKEMLPDVVVTGFAPPPVVETKEDAKPEAKKADAKPAEKAKDATPADKKADAAAKDVK